MGGLGKTAAIILSAAAAPLLFSAPSWGIGAPAFPVYTQQSQYYDSGICTSTGIVWDTTFASWVGNTLNSSNYNEIAFDFNECYGGGMIDDLTPLNLAPAAYTSASSPYETAWAGSRDTSTNANLPANYYSIELTKSLIGGNTFMTAAQYGYNNCLVGPVVNKPSAGNPIETPQYTSSGPIGDSIILGQNNPENPTNNTKYLAVLYAGPTKGVTDVDDANSLAQQFNYLNGLGGGATYGNGANIDVLSSGGAGGNLPGYPGIPSDASDSAASLKAAWKNFIGNNTNSHTQIFFSDLGHGTSAFNYDLFLHDASETIQNGVTQAYTLTQSFVQQAQQITNNLLSQGYSLGTTAFPFFEIQSPQQISGLSVTVDGNVLPVIGTPVDLYGDGSEYEYDFELTDADIQALTTSDSTDITWSGSQTPTFDEADLNLGEDADVVAENQDSVPEPGAAVLVVIALGAGATLRPTRKPLA